MLLTSYFFDWLKGCSCRRKLINILKPGLLALCVSTSVNAETTLEMEETEITGARELPKVLYIVPWKKTRPDSRPLPMRSLVDEALSPIDVDEFKRRVRYHGMTQAPTDKNTK